MSKSIETKLSAFDVAAKCGSYIDKVIADGKARADLIKVLQAKGADQKLLREAHVIGRLSLSAVAHVKGKTAAAIRDLVCDIIDGELDEPAWFKAADAAARKHWSRVLSEANVSTEEKRGGARDNAGRKGATNQDAPKTEKAKTEKPAPIVEDKVVAFKPKTPRDSALFIRDNIAALLSIAQGAGNSTALVKVLTEALKQSQVELTNAE